MNSPQIDEQADSMGGRSVKSGLSNMGKAAEEISRKMKDLQIPSKRGFKEGIVALAFANQQP